MKRLTSALIIASALSATAFGVQARTYKLATNVPADGAPGQMLQEFADNVKAKTDGRVEFRIFWNGTLGGQEQYIQQVQSGVIDAGLINSGTLENLVPEVGVLNLPYMFRSTTEYETTLLNPEVQKVIQAAAEDKKLNMLGFLNNGFRNIYTTKEVKTLEDLQGLKIRTVPSETYIKTFRAFGAVATPMDFSEIYPALQQGLIDGAEGGLGALWELKFGEVTKFGLRSEHTRLTDFVLTSPRFVKRVGDDYPTIQKEFEKISSKSVEFIENMIADSEKKAEQNMGVKINTIDKEVLIERVQPIYKETAQNPAKKPLLETILKVQNRSL